MVCGKCVGDVHSSRNALRQWCAERVQCSVGRDTPPHPACRAGRRGFDPPSGCLVVYHRRYVNDATNSILITECRRFLEAGKASGPSLRDHSLQ